MRHATKHMRGRFTRNGRINPSVLRILVVRRAVGLAALDRSQTKRGSKMTKNETRELNGTLKYRAGDGRMFATQMEAEIYRVGLAKRTGITIPVDQWDTVRKVSIKVKPINVWR